MRIPSYTDYLAHKERYEDLIREAEKARLIGAILGPSPLSEANRRAIGWLGAQMVKLGARLQQYGATSPRRLA